MTTNIRIDDLRKRMRASNVDLVVLGPGAHMQWLLGFHPHADERPCLACISQSGAGILMPAVNAEGSRAHTDLQFFQWSDAEGPAGAFEKLLDKLDATNAASIALDETMRADFAALVQDRLPAAARQFSASTIGHLRLIKDAAEYACLKENAAIADAAMQAGWATMREGMSEIEVASVIRAEFLARGARPLFSIVDPAFAISLLSLAAPVSDCE